MFSIAITHAYSLYAIHLFFLLGVCRRLCLARLLNRSGFRFVTFFAFLVHSRFASFRLPRASAYIHQSRLTSPHTRALFRHIEPVEMHLSFSTPKSKKMRQTFVLSAEVVPVLPHSSSSLYTSPFAQLADGSRPQAIFRFDILDFQCIKHSSSNINNSDNCLPSHSCRHHYLFFKNKSSFYPIKSPNVRNPHICFFRAL